MASLRKKICPPDGGHEMGTSCLNPDLRQWLPEHLVDLILSKLPFSDLVRLCCVCKRWRKLILSAEISGCSSRTGRLFHFERGCRQGLLWVLSTSGDRWMFVSLRFLGYQHRLLDVVASDGGLLCFSTSLRPVLIVCNPLTKSHKRLVIPTTRMSTSTTENAWIMPSALDEFTDVGDEPSLFSASPLLVGMVVDSDSGHFKLVVAVMCELSLHTVSMLYDSRANSWKSTADLPRDLPGTLYSEEFTSIASGGNSYFSCVGDSVGSKMLKYDMDEETWNWIYMPLDMTGAGSNLPRRVVTHNGKMLLMTISDIYNMDDFDPWMFGCYDLLVPKPPVPTCSIRGPTDPLGDMETEMTACVHCVGQGDVIYFVKKSPARLRSIEEKIQLRVICHNFSTNVNGWIISRVLYPWSVINPYLVGPPRQFQVFKPSMVVIN